MKKWIACIGAAVVIGALSVSTAEAKPPKKGVTCSVCHMDLTSKKDKSHTKAVKIGKKTYYCCSACDMSKKKK